MLSVKMPATSAELSQSADVVSSITFSMIFVFLSAAESCRYSAVLTDLLVLQDEDSLPQLENQPASTQANMRRDVNSSVAGNILLD